MKLYTVIDQTIHSISQGDKTFLVEDGSIELPVEIAEEFIAYGQIKKYEEAKEDLGPEKPMTAAQKRAAAKAAKAAEAAEDSEGEE